MSRFAQDLVLRVRPASLLAALVLLTLLGALGCAREPGPLWADPGALRFDTERTEIAVRIHNTGATVRPIGEFALTGEDWDALRFVDESLPRTVPARDAVLVRLEISRAAFRTAPGVYRSGRASLEFRSDEHGFRVPIEFVGTGERRPGAPPPSMAIILLALLGLAALLLPRGAAPLARLRAASVTTRRERLLVAAAVAALLLLVALIPFGAGLCRGRLGARVGPAELAQCRAGLGGYELSLLPAQPGLWWWLIALALAAALLALLRLRSHAAPALLALPFVRVLGFALALASLVVGLAPASAAAVELALAQSRIAALANVPLPAWGLVAQPLACAATFALALRRPPSPGAEPLHAALERFDRLVWAALITVVYLGAWSIPGLSDRPVPPLRHAGMLAVELAAFAAKLALVDLALRKLGAALAERQISPATLLRAHGRWTIPLLFVHLLAVTLWRLA